MKKLLFLFFFLISPIVSAKKPDTKQKINLFTFEYSPFVSKNLKNEGPLADFVRTAFKSVGYNTEITFLPWARGLSDSKEGYINHMA